MYNFLKSFEKSKKRPEPGDLVAVDSANPFINAYNATGDFSFANVAFTANNRELGIVIDAAADEKGSILYHYVRVLFQRGMVGIVHYGLLRIVTEEFEPEEV